MPLSALPFHFMRGGTSRGPYFHRADLPEDLDVLAEVLLAVVGAGHPLNIDGIGGGSAVTTKVAMLSPSDHPWADVDYFFAQVAADKGSVDYKPSCGNILAGVGPAAIEMGLVRAEEPVTSVKIRATNIDAFVEAAVQTPGGQVEYEGETRIDGVPGTAAPILLDFMHVVGSETGALFPTGRAREEIGGIEVTCIDVAVPMVIARASDLGVTGYESKADLDADRAFFTRMEPIRIEAGARMGLGDVRDSVVPKFAILAPPHEGAAVTARYFMPWDTHPSMAVTGSICIGACGIAPGTIAEGLARPPSGSPALLRIEEPMGVIEVQMAYDSGGDTFDLEHAKVLRTARKLASGEVFVPSHLLA